MLYPEFCFSEQIRYITFFISVEETSEDFDYILAVFNKVPCKLLVKLCQFYYIVITYYIH